MDVSAAPDVAGMMSMFEAVEAGGAYAGMDTTAVHTGEHTEVLGQSYEDGNILDTMAAVSCWVALVNTTYHVVSEVEAWGSGHRAACPMDGGS